jgi:hypothetical protein
MQLSLELPKQEILPVKYERTYLRDLQDKLREELKREGVDLYIWQDGLGQLPKNCFTGQTALDLETYGNPEIDIPTNKSGKRSKKDYRALCYELNKIAMIGLMDDETCLLVLHPTEKDFTRVKDLLLQRKPKIVGSNLYFDLLQLKHHLDICPWDLDVHWDVVTVSRLYHAGIGLYFKHGLKDIARRMLNVEMDKDLAISFSHKVVSFDQCLYNIKDLKLPLLITEEQKKDPLIDVDLVSEECSSTRLFVEMAYNGLPIDREETNKVKNEWFEYVQGIKKEFESRFHISIDSNSAKLANHLAETGYEYGIREKCLSEVYKKYNIGTILGIHIDNGKLKLLSAKEDYLFYKKIASEKVQEKLKEIGIEDPRVLQSTSKDLLMQSHHPACPYLLAYRNAKTFYDCFVGALSSDNGDGRVHCDFNQVAKEGVGRSSSTKRADGTGRNLQNIPNHKPGDIYSGCSHIPSFRDMVKPPKGWKLVTLDLSGAHQAISVTKSKCKITKDLLYGDSGQDSHSIVASLVLKKAFNLEISPEEIKMGSKSDPPDPLRHNDRQFSKETFYSVLNGCTEYSIGNSVLKFYAGVIEDLDKSTENVNRLGKIVLDCLRETFPQWCAYIDTRLLAVKHQYKKAIGNYTYSPLIVDGYPYWVNTRKAKTKDVTAVNWLRTEGISIKRACTEIRRYYDSKFAPFLLLEHDSIVFLIREENTKECEHINKIFVDTFHSLLDPDIKPMKYRAADVMMKDIWGK